MPGRVDPTSSLASWQIDIAIGTHLYSIAPHPASDWLIALLDDFGSFDAVIELLSVKDRAAIEQDVIDGKVDITEKTKAFQEAVEVAGGRPWWQIINYLNLARGFWGRFHGRVLAAGLTPDTVSFAAYLDALYFAFIENRDEQATQKIINFLETPPPGLEVELDEDVEGDTFLAMLNQQR